MAENSLGELILALGWMCFGMSALTFMVWFIVRDVNAAEDRRIMEQREFGFRPTPKRYLKRIRPSRHE